MIELIYKIPFITKLANKNHKVSNMFDLLFSIEKESKLYLCLLFGIFFTVLGLYNFGFIFSIVFFLLAYIHLHNVFDYVGYVYTLNNEYDLPIRNLRVPAFRIMVLLFKVSMLTTVLALNMNYWIFVPLSIIITFTGIQDYLFYLYSDYKYPENWTWMTWTYMGWFNKKVITTQNIVLQFILTFIIIIGFLWIVY